MKIISVVRQTLEGTYTGFVTDPPLTDEIVKEIHRARGDELEEFIYQKNGCLIVDNRLIDRIQGETVIETMTEQLTAAEEVIKERKNEAERVYNRKIAAAEKKYGIPVVSRDGFGSA